MGLFGVRLDILHCDMGMSLGGHKADCVGLNQSIFPRLCCLNTEFPVGGTVLVGLGSMT